MSDDPRLLEYDFELPASRIAQRPAAERTASRLMRWAADGRLEHRSFPEIVDLVREGDLLVLNDTRVFPARLFGRKEGGRAEVEILLVRPRADVEAGAWEALLRPGRRLAPGTRVRLDGDLVVVVGERTADGTGLVHFEDPDQVSAHCREHGHVPLPPYIDRDDDTTDLERYQTVFARTEGSVAAPTAGLHFDDALLTRIDAAGVRRAAVTLHVGPGTFRPLTARDLEAGHLHAEWCDVGAATCDALRATRARGGRVIAVGTTACRTLESTPTDPAPWRGETDLFIRPGHAFRWVDVLITNFHLPRSSLLMLVDALTPGRWRAAYAEAIEREYRFYSYGDANWIERTA